MDDEPFRRFKQAVLGGDRVKIEQKIRSELQQKLERAEFSDGRVVRVAAEALTALLINREFQGKTTSKLVLDAHLLDAIRSNAESSLLLEGQPMGTETFMGYLVFGERDMGTLIRLTGSDGAKELDLAKLPGQRL